MKTKQLLAYLFVVLTSVFLIACDKEENTDTGENQEVVNELSYVIFGGTSFNNKFVSFNDFVPDINEAGFVDSIGLSRLFSAAQWNGEFVSLDIYFPTTEIGHYFMQAPEPPDFVIDPEHFFKAEIGANEFYMRYINVYIDEYGEVGERIIGRFDGQVYDFSTGQQELLSINNGEFNLLRTN